jgi:metal transporter CNNM
LVNRVGENWPLYDILNQFKKGQSHMAVVLKEKIRTAASDTDGMNKWCTFINYLHSKSIL